jgi:hypothetical protein
MYPGAKVRQILLMGRKLKSCKLKWTRRHHLALNYDPL